MRVAAGSARRTAGRLVDLPAMTAESHPNQPADLLEDLRRAEHAFERTASNGADIRSVLTRIESATPGGAPLHAQLDNVRKWLDAFERPADHERFGGAGHLRDYVLTQLRLALAALEDYHREMLKDG